ncbi:formimidoylglutamate deiminase [Ruegeria pomeroyi]|uniref:Formimidoylglutamate deiminase n=1 Tax=Ruegeria pomeroyi TaxID=89184 RepID=A0A9Q3ZKP0_9RHOB|nr:formimidoylglutamate deiminase [Ruegeria pomeroyi]MCE8536145.1 formimidoylglutamate deiminase [Ruegeria pomeroyi]
MTVFANRLLGPKGWLSDARVTLDGLHIASVEPDSAPLPDDVRVDTLLPAPGNLHSHSFQRAMAGMTEYRSRGRESFWTWRELMYRFLDRLTPEHVAAIAAQTFVEMQKAGYAAVGEFHYLHHRPGGGPYDDRAEMSARILQAAAETGIGLTLLPVLYTHGGADGRALAGGQLRFGNELDAYCTLVEGARAHASTLPADARVGIAPHSLRAVSAADLAEVAARHPDGPVHIHIAEQTREVEEIEAAYGARPVDWLLNNAAVGPRWCLIHATHMTDAETRAMAATGAVAGLCPITEANLGDGIFNGVPYLEARGAFGVGSDSNVLISLTEELRLLEYSQRLRDRERNVLAGAEGSTGSALYLGAVRGGARALDRGAGEIAPGALADLVAIDSGAPALCALEPGQLLDGLIFAAGDRVVTDLWSAGRHQVRAGRHVAEDAIARRYGAVLRDLLSRI